MSRVLTGLSAWLMQRLSAVYLALFTLVAGGFLLISPPVDWTAWRALFVHPVGMTAWALFFVALLLHSWVGMRDVILDYGRSTGVRLLLLTVVGGWIVVLLLWSLRILLGVMLE